MKKSTLRKKQPFTRFRFPFAGGVCIVSKSAIKTRLNRQYRRSICIALNPDEWFVLARLLRQPGTHLPADIVRWYLRRSRKAAKKYAPYHLMADVRMKIIAATNNAVNVKSKRYKGYYVVIRTE